MSATDPSLPNVLLTSPGSPPLQADGSDEGIASPLIKFSMVVLVLVAVVLACYLSIDRDRIPAALSKALAPLFAVGVATMLASFPLIVGFVQATSRTRQIRKLQGIANWPVAETTYYAVALASLNSLRPASVTHDDYRVPMIAFSVTVIVCTLSVFLCCDLTGVFDYKSFILGGAEIIGQQPVDINKYQVGTFAAIAFAFVGAYVYIIARLLARINNNDIYPISFHFYTAWIISAGLIAAVLRHSLYLFAADKVPDAPVILGFATGLAPNLFLGAISRRAFSYFNIIGDKADPGPQLFPTNMNLLMIDGITNDQIDRLGELGIANAQVLSNQNPFVLWPRLPYELSLLVGWIAQAQLYRKVRDEGFSILRANQIGDIFDLYTYLSVPAAQSTVCSLLKMPEALAQPMLASLEADASFVRLKAVRDAMARS